MNKPTTTANTTSGLSLRDQVDLMERPFFALTKTPRTEPIVYSSGDGIEVKVIPGQGLGIATIWDADILIWAASVITRQKNAGEEPTQILRTSASALLRAIGRGTSGYEHKRLKEALDRLQATAVRTSIRTTTKRRRTGFSWIEWWSFEEDPETGRVGNLVFKLSDWIFAGITMDGGVLMVDPAYFNLTGAMERWLYRVARKHAGNQAHGFTISMVVLHHKSGSMAPLRNFALEVRKIAARNRLPGYRIELEPRKLGMVVVMKPRKPTRLPH